MSGGGARAAYQVGVLRALSRRWPDFRTPIISGVSAGAINAVALAARSGTFSEAVGMLSRLWRDLRTEQVFRTDAGSLGRIAGTWARRLVSGGRSGSRTNGLLDTSPLRKIISSTIGGIDGPTAIDRNIYRGGLDALGITATDYGTGRSVTWVQGRGVRAWDLPKRLSIRAGIGVDHVMASSALPLIFPSINVGGAWYGDGGVRQISPLSPLVHLGADRIIAVNTRFPKPMEVAGISAIKDSPPPAQIVGVLMNAIFLDTMDQDADNLRRLSKLLERLPEEERDGLRPVDSLVIRPSVDLGRLAADFEVDLPRTFRFLMRGLGTLETESPDWLSMLLFEPGYLRAVMDIGEADAEARLDEIAAFIDRPAPDRRPLA